MAFGTRRAAAAAPGTPRSEAAGTPRSDTNGDAVSAKPTRGRVAAARGAWAVGSVLTLIARIVRVIVGAIVVLIVAGILLRVLGANAGNSLVKDVHDAAKFFVGPFDGMFTISNPKVAIAVNWGIAALVYLLVGGFIARLLARAAPRGVPPTEPVL